MSSVLLDTHVLIWLSENDFQLPSSVLKIIDDIENIFVSVISLWEIAIKLNIGKITLQEDFNMIESKFSSTRLMLLPLSIKDTVQLHKLAIFPEHKDPFDRMLIAQAIARSIPLVSADTKFDLYLVKRIWE